MKLFSCIIFLCALILAEISAARITYRARNYANIPPSVTNQPMYVVAVNNNNRVNPYYISPTRAYLDPTITNDNMKDVDEPEEDESTDTEEKPSYGYIPVQDSNGATYLLHESALQNMEQPEMMPENLMMNQQTSDDPEEEILVPNGSIEVLAGEVMNKRTGENSIVIPEDAIADLGTDDVLALVEDPEMFGNTKQLIIRRRRPSYYSRPQYPVRRYQQYSGRRPFRGMRGAVIRIGSVKLYAYPGGRRRITFQ